MGNPQYHITRYCKNLFQIENDFLILLHGFLKKTQKTPDKELAVALARLKEFEEMNQ